jgi:hypothetical protein
MKYNLSVYLNLKMIEITEFTKGILQSRYT